MGTYIDQKRPTSTLASSSTTLLPSTSQLPPLPPQNLDAALFFEHASHAVLDCITHHLGPADRVVLSLTCRGLRARLARAADAPALRQRLAPLEFLSFLSTIARDLPDDYVCEACFRLHREEHVVHNCTGYRRGGRLARAHGHGRDVCLVEQASKKAKSSEPELELPCQRRLRSTDADEQLSSYSISPSLSSFSAATTTTVRCDSVPIHSFAGTLSSARRTPLAGLLHRDVQLMLKRARMLKTMDQELLANRLPATDEENKNGWRLAAFFNAVFSGTAEALRQRKHRHDSKTQNTKTKHHGRHADKKADDRRRCQRLQSAMQEALRPLAVDIHLEREIDYLFLGSKATINYAFAPRIVDCVSATSDKQGDRHEGNGEWPRLLLRTVVRFSYLKQRHFPLSICPHQLANHRESKVWKDKQMEAAVAKASAQYSPYQRRSSIGEDVPITQEEEGPVGVHPPFRLDTAVDVVAQEISARSHEREESLYVLAGSDGTGNKNGDWDDDLDVTGCCHRCPTDFSISTRGKELEVTVWQDFGPEGPVSDLHWQSHLPGYFRPAGEGGGEEPFNLPNTWMSGLSVPHRPGSIREMYIKAAVDVVAK